MVAITNQDQNPTPSVLEPLGDEEVSRSVDGQSRQDEAASSLSFASLLEDLLCVSSRTLARAEQLANRGSLVKYAIEKAAPSKPSWKN